MTNHRNIVHELHEYLRKQSHWKTVFRWLLIGIFALIVIVWFGRDAIEEIKAAEDWIAGHGLLGWFAFIGLIIICNSLFVPLSILSIAGGAMFGITGGTVLVFMAAVLTAAIDYLAARSLLRKRIEKMLEQHPKLRAIQLAVLNKGLRLQILLRMGPISAASVSYVLGATSSRFSTFLIGTVGLLPSVILNVYFGYAASHVTKVAGNSSEHSMLQTVATVVGLVIAVVVIIVVTRVATKAFREFELAGTDAA